MSEYSYYEFQAVDRPLTADEMRVLRSCSTRARITPTSFVNVYNWGGFKGDPDAWMERYFDAFLYVGNVRMHLLMLRLPSRLLDPAIARVYSGRDRAFVRHASGNVILSFESVDEDGGEWVEGDGLLSSLISARAELARGDLRALYLNWLLYAQAGQLDDADKEPAVPPGLGQLSASLRSLVEFLRIDADLLNVAAQASPPTRDLTLERPHVLDWVERLPSGEKDQVFADLIVNPDLAQIMELLQRYLKEGAAAPAPGGRTVRQLLQAAARYATERERTEAERRAAEEAQRQRETAIAREECLSGLVGREDELWERIDDLVATRQPKSYDEAVTLLVDLRDLYARNNQRGFPTRVEALRREHARRASFIERLKKLGL